MATPRTGPGAICTWGAVSTRRGTTLSKALEAHESTEDETAKALKYWLGRSQEGDGQVDDALATYGELLQVDYNYRDVRGRIDGLKNK